VLQRVSRLLDSPLYAIPARGKSRAGTRLNITGHTALNVMVAIRPYMGTRRGRQIDKALNAWENRPNRPTEKLCACGCGRTVVAGPRRIYADSATVNGKTACAQRAYRKRRAA
jgi:hypothetical protein